MSILGGLGFGSGVIYAAPQSGSGNPAINPTPQSPGVIQNVKFDLDAEIKGLSLIHIFAAMQKSIDDLSELVKKLPANGTIAHTGVGDGLAKVSEFQSLLTQ